MQSAYPRSALVTSSGSPSSRAANTDTRTKLEREIDRQNGNPGKWVMTHLTNRLRQHVEAGQPKAEAIDELMRQYHTLLEAADLTAKPATPPQADEE
ncbi:MAG TPA: hypothetical protein VGP82_16070 [Ktedonobacterales bacterium]|jgi:nucleotide-binding universal stress UspA family protein|nr:hypothetical protein [Ktedonobacterales bacterium]